MFEYNSNPEPVQRRSPVARITGLLLFSAILLRIFSSFAYTEKAFWVCFFAWAVLSVIGDFSRKREEKPQRPGPGNEKPEISGWWKAFGPLAAFIFITIFLGLWPLGGLGILLWLISWVAYDFYESSRFGKRGLTTLSLR